MITVQLVLCCSLVASNADTKLLVEEFDLRKPGARSDGNEHFVIFSARAMDLSKGDVGHVWVTWLKRDRNGQIGDIESFGFYPGSSEGKNKLCAFDCPPKVVNELWKSGPREEILKETHRLILKVDQIPYLKSKHIREKWRTEAEKYDLLSNSCKHFVADVASFFEIKSTVSSTDRPDTFLVHLIEEARLKLSKANNE